MLRFGVVEVTIRSNRENLTHGEPGETGVEHLRPLTHIFKYAYVGYVTLPRRLAFCLRLELVISSPIQQWRYFRKDVRLEQEISNIPSLLFSLSLNDRANVGLADVPLAVPLLLPSLVPCCYGRLAVTERLRKTRENKLTDSHESFVCYLKHIYRTGTNKILPPTPCVERMRQRYKY